MKPLDFTYKLPSQFIINSPLKGDAGHEVEMICPDDERGGCGFPATGLFSTESKIPKEEVHDCKCPKCGEPMVLYWGEYLHFGIAMKGPGYSETKCGMRMKRDRIRRSESLAKSQWENHQPQTIGDPTKIRNPTEGGPLDPNSRFHKGKKKKGQIYT